jgi:hypothetical protein
MPKGAAKPAHMAHEDAVPHGNKKRKAEAFLVVFE